MQPLHVAHHLTALDIEDRKSSRRHRWRTWHQNFYIMVYKCQRNLSLVPIVRPMQFPELISCLRVPYRNQVAKRAAARIGGAVGGNLDFDMGLGDRR